MPTDTAVASVMTAPVETIDPDATIAEAARLLDERGIGSLVVGEGRIQGILTESDVVASVGAERDPTTTTVADLMSEPVVTIRPHESIQVAGDRMGSNGVKKLPVTEAGEAVGIVTTTDLALHLPDYRIEMASQPEPDVKKGEYE